ncbi:uncharacterized protein LOC115621626 [Scaptodrosophila lebanonensis]|uniref:Uncharacterized protein LOC115621626 n=1 Tax=Drosophila lebanonensis TaxID=7225 RepID=A0A6J2T7S6_DROLE|nr:uncharacterized protein LOC115621626 [Scaptodrosophila lebanonensis]
MCVRSILLTICGLYALFALTVAGQNVTNDKISNNNSSLSSEEEERCGSTQDMVDECFKDLPPHLMEFLQNTKVVISKKEIIAKCNVFNRGMKCFDAYSARCLQNRKLSMFKNNVEGARKFFIKFCSDVDFQRDYLRHKDCFAYIQLDWVRCTKEFQNILTEELHDTTRNVTDKFMEFCCARYAYENCIYNSARFKCYKHSAEFARETAKMLSDEKHFSNCRYYEDAICAGTQRFRASHSRGLLFFLFLLLLSRRMMQSHLP